MPSPRPHLSSRLVALLALAAALLGGTACRTSIARPTSGAAPQASDVGAPSRAPVSRPAARHVLGAADGLVTGRVTAFADVPAVTRLKPALRTALRRAARDAARVGIKLDVDSGWRSPAYQEELLREAIAKYGSRDKAARWVATPATSAHVSGDAVDVGGSAARKWLAMHGSAYGLCRTYRNEPWHFELRPKAVEHGCPRMYADPSHDPRLQR